MQVTLASVLVYGDNRRNRVAELPRRLQQARARSSLDLLPGSDTIRQRTEPQPHQLKSSKDRTPR